MLIYKLIVTLALNQRCSAERLVAERLLLEGLLSFSHSRFVLNFLSVRTLHMFCKLVNMCNKKSKEWEGTLVSLKSEVELVEKEG